MKQYILFGSFHTLYICSILAGAVYNWPGGQNLMIFVIFAAFAFNLSKLTDKGIIALADAPSPPTARSITMIVHGIAMILLVWHGWLLLTFLVVVAAASKLVADHCADELILFGTDKKKKRHIAQLDLNELSALAKQHSSSYASPHHFTLSVVQLRIIILIAVARHYDITKEEAYTEVTDPEA